MSVDLSQFYAVFFDEAAEHLANMESLLLALDPQAATDDELNAIFRAAHSIKGGAGTFGFRDIAEVTHVAETLLDRVRKRELVATTAMIDALLKSGDVIKGMLDAHRAGAPVDDDFARDVCAELEQLTHGAQPQAPEPAAEAAPAAAAPKACWKIAFKSVAPDAAIDNLLGELAALGTVTPIHLPKRMADANTAPKRARRFELQVQGAVDAAQIAELLSFITDSDQQTIEAAPVSADQTAGDPGYGFFADAQPQAADAGYGFFDEPQPQPQAADPGYGFFADAQPAAAAGPAETPAGDAGYGFFQDAAGAPAQPRNYGRRATDLPGVIEARAGRRANDKTVVAPGAENNSIRVSVDKVDQLINLVGELVITQAMLTQDGAGLDPVIYERLLGGLDQLARNTRDLQDSVMSIRMMPIAFVFNRFPRVVRELAAKLGKRVELHMSGEGTELDKTLIERLADPLTHLVRNSLDHGIETPEKRIAAGKPEVGSIELRAQHQSGHIVIEIADDGGGLNREKILEKARSRGMAVSDTMSDQEVWQLIFEAGFSTAEQVTEVSGRGVGMDVVRRNIQELGGRVEIESQLGVGTRIRVRLPLTLAILDGMSVAMGEELFIIPLTMVVESLQPAPSDLHYVAGRGRLVQVRNEYLPVVALHEVMGGNPATTDPSAGVLVIVECVGSKAALFVDGLVGQHQVVIKSLESNYRKVWGVSGATIMGDGKVALILDIPAIVGPRPEHLLQQAA
jgi:two-component system chemotaxis sensor kinase CheA